MIGKLTQSSPVNRGIAALALVLGLAATCAVFAYPTPAASSTRWELDFRPGDLRLYRDAYDNQYYWYFTYKVTNRTGADQTWAPTFALFNDASEILNSGIGVPRRVTSDILEMLGNDLMENQYEIIGEIRQGREHAKEGLVIWPAREHEITDMSLFIGGISGETARVTNPLTGEELLLRKTLQRDYHIPGNAIGRGTRPADFVRQRWVFR